MDWQPIETAPKDGTEILGYGPWAGECGGVHAGAEVCTIQWKNGHTDYRGYEWEVTHSDMYGVWQAPTHWMPMPSPPGEPIL